MPSNETTKYHKNCRLLNEEESAHTPHTNTHTWDDTLDNWAASAHTRAHTLQLNSGRRLIRRINDCKYCYLRQCMWNESFYDAPETWAWYDCVVVSSIQPSIANWWKWKTIENCSLMEIIIIIESKMLGIISTPVSRKIARQLWENRELSIRNQRNTKRAKKSNNRVTIELHWMDIGSNKNVQSFDFIAIGTDSPVCRLPTLSFRFPLITPRHPFDCFFFYSPRNEILNKWEDKKICRKKDRREKMNWNRK